MDQELRQLKRRALEGDLQAAILYAQALNRADQLIDPIIKLDVEVKQLEIQRPRVRGTLAVVPINAESVSIRTRWIQSPDGVQEFPIIINTVAYQFVARYYFYPETGWIPFHPSAVAHAKHHQDNISKHYPDRPWSFYLPRPENNTIRCDTCQADVSGFESDFRLRRVGGQLANATPARTLDAILRDEIPKWLVGNRDIMRISQLNFLQNQKQAVRDQLNDLMEQIAEVQERLGSLIIEELQIKDPD